MNDTRNAPETLADLFGEVISSYSREQAIEDGELVAIGDEAREAGFTIDLALTRALFGRIEAIPTAAVGIQDIAGRLWDVLWMARCAAGRNTHVESFNYQLHLAAKGDRKRLITLRCTVSGGDQGEPVITIGFPEDF